MNITLRKANAVQSSITEAIRGISVSTVLELNEFQDIEKELERANTQVFVNDQRRQKLLMALYNIRGLVGAANATSGIDLLLTKCAFVDKRVSQLQELVQAQAVTDLTVIKGKLEKIKTRPADARASLYGREDTVSTGLLSQAQIDQIKEEVKTLKKQKQKMNDEILESNIKTEIPLSEETVAVLTAEGLL